MTRPWIVPATALVLAAAAFAGSRAALSAPAPAPAATYAGDTVHSFVLFKVKHMGASWSFGRFDDFTVSFQAGEGGADLASIEFAVKTESIDTGNEKRDQHLRSPDFLNAKQFPEVTFKSTATKALDADTTEVTGDLTLHGVTKPVTVKVTKVGTGDMRGTALVGYETTFTVKRSEFGMTNMVGPVGDEIAMTVAVEGAKK